ncbi:MAG TPA: GNAT family N-acetyltransferase [Chitinophagaceae bacterium]|nr:GNAT family N-acetyltransferase [Chitinophagaceae bacterium]
MKEIITAEDITIRTTLQPGDIGYVTYLHGDMYSKEYGYGISFEAYVAQGLCEFYRQYNPARDRVWLCEHNSTIVGFLLLMNRGGDTAQLRYFILLKPYRGIGLGKKLLQLLMGYLKAVGYKKCYLWTTNEQETAAALYKRAGFVLTEEKPSGAFGKPLFEQRYDAVLYK